MTTRPAALSSDHVVWEASMADHPARSASMASYSAVCKGDLDEWLALYAEDAVVQDPVGPSMFDPEGRGHHGHEGIAAFWKLAIEPIDVFRFTIRESFAHALTCANFGEIKTSFADGSYTVTDLITVHEVDETGIIVSMKAYWEPDRTMASFTKAP